MKVLLVEDEVKLARAIARTLELHSIHTVISNTGSQGLTQAQHNSFDVIILDEMLPELSGIEICSSLRDEQNQTPIIFLTAKSQIEDKVAGFTAGADDYLVKPFAFVELLSRIKALARRSTQLNRLIQVGNLQIDPETHRIAHNGDRIALSVKEFQILVLLAQNKGSTLTKQQIVSQIWPYDTDVLPSTVEVHIKNLRDKVDKPFQTQHIKTIRGFGYMIE